MSKNYSRHAFLILSVLFVWGAIYSSYSLLVYKSEKSLDVISANASLEKELLAQTLSERSEFFSRARLHVERGVVASQQAQALRDDARRVKLLCEGLSQFGEAIRFEPLNSRYLVNWANLRQTLGDVTCTEPYTSGSFKEAVSLALTQSPTSPDILYAAALVQYWSGDLKAAKEGLHRFLLLGTGVTDSQKTFIFSIMQKPEDFESIVPFRFPQIGTWISYLKGRHVQGFDDAFERSLLIALDAAVKEFKVGAIPLQYHTARLTQVYDLEIGDDARRVVDGIVRDLLASRGEEVSADYFSMRSRLEEIKVVRGVSWNDLRPFKTPLVDWGYGSTIQFDTYHQSIGFFLPEGYRTTLIEMVPSSENSELDPSAVKLYVSDDNQKWNEITGVRPKAGIRLGSTRFYAIQNQGAQGKYWKLTFDRADRIKRFSNVLGKLLRVYGERSE